jgi:hypothetical protein
MNKEMNDGPGFGFVINVLKVYIGSNSARFAEASQDEL